jgi:hypothetical protein
MNRWDKQHVLDGPEQIKPGERHMQAWGEARMYVLEVLQKIAAQVCIDVYNRSRIILVFYKVDECNVQVKNKP